MYADVIVDITHEKLDKIFQYRIPDTLKDRLCIGSEVIVPFGKDSRICRWIFRETGLCAGEDQADS